MSTRICNVLGVWEDWGGKYQLIPSSDEKGTGLKSSGTQVRESRRNKRKEGKETVGVFAMVWNFGTSFAKWSFPGLELDLGQSKVFGRYWSRRIADGDLNIVLVIVAYMLTVILCVVLASQLIDNPNRAGSSSRLFHCLTQILTCVFLLYQVS